MPVIDHFNLRSFDLNLLLAFDALMQESSVTRAASRLKLQQPAMSHALSSLRMLMNDDLFVRSGQTMQPTPRALALAAPVRDLLEGAQNVLLTRPTFDLGREERTFRVGLSAELEILLMPALIGRLRQEGPGVRVLARTVNRQQVGGLLDDGSIDLAVGCFEQAAAWHSRRGLFDETHLCCFQPDLLKASVPISAAEYLTAPHALVSLKDSLFGCLEDALVRAGVRLNVVTAAPHFLTALTMASEAPLLTTLPARVVERYARPLGLAISPLPIALEPFSVGLLWHARSNRDAASEWLRTEIASIFSEIP